MAVYMQIDGIQGDVTTDGYKNWIEIETLNWGVSRDIAAKKVDREASRPVITELTITKLMDKASPYIFSAACVDKAKKIVKIHFCQTGDKISPYMEITLSNALISNYTMQAISKAGKTEASEVVAVNFDKIEMKYTPYDEKHNPQAPIPVAYDLAAAKLA